MTAQAIKELLGERLQGHNGNVVSLDVLAGKNIGLYFSAHWCPPCRGFTPQLAAWYSGLKEDMNREDFEIIFVSSDRSEHDFDEYFKEMPWLALPFSERARKASLSKIYKVDGIPTLVFLNREGKVITKNGRDRVAETAKNPNFKFEDWAPQGFWQVMGTDPVLTKNEAKISIEELRQKEAIGIYFSAHWCPPCRGFTPELAKTYESIQQTLGKNKCEIVFASSDRQEDQFREYFETMPWLAFPFGDPRIKKLSAGYEVDGIPTLVIVDREGKVITKDGRTAASSDPTGAQWPWKPQPVEEMTESCVGYINSTPICAVFTPSNQWKDEAVRSLTPTAIKTMDQDKDKEEPSMRFLWAGTNDIVTRVKEVCAIIPPTDKLYMVIIDIGDGKIYEQSQDIATVTPQSVELFVDFFKSGALAGRALE